MALSEEMQHDLLLLITSLIFIIYSSGLATPTEVVTEQPILIP